MLGTMDSSTAPAQTATIAIFDIAITHYCPILGPTFPSDGGGQQRPEDRPAHLAHGHEADDPGGLGEPDLDPDLGVHIRPPLQLGDEDGAVADTQPDGKLAKVEGAHNKTLQ